MGTFVAVMGAEPPPGVRGSGPWGSWAALSWSDPTVLATDPEARAAETDRLLVLTPRAGTRRAQLAAATVAAVRPDLPVRVESLPVSTSVLVRAVESVPASTSGANETAAAITHVATSAVWGAWMPSVAKLERPAPTLGQHVRSWFARGAGFLAVHGDPGWVERLPLDGVDQSRRRPRSQVAGQATPYDAHMFGGLPEDAIAALFARGLTGRPFRREPLGDAAELWGSPKAVEFVIVPSVPEAYRSGHPLDGEDKGTCPVCAEPVWGPCCTYCRAAPAPRSREAVRTAPTSGPTPGGQG